LGEGIIYKREGVKLTLKHSPLVLAGGMEEDLEKRVWDARAGRRGGKKMRKGKKGNFAGSLLEKG